jgi:hypothetical protein
MIKSTPGELASDYMAADEAKYSSANAVSAMRIVGFTTDYTPCSRRRAQKVFVIEFQLFRSKREAMFF